MRYTDKGKKSNCCAKKTILKKIQRGVVHEYY